MARKHDFNKVPTRTIETVELPSPDPSTDKTPIECRIRSMYGREKVDLENSMSDETGKTIPWRINHYRELEAAFCLVDDNGKRIFSDADVQNGERWTKLHPGFLRALLSEVRRVNGDAQAIDVDEVKNLPDVELTEPPDVLPLTSADQTSET